MAAEAIRADVVSVGSIGSAGPLVELRTEEFRPYAGSQSVLQYTRFAFVNVSEREGIFAEFERRPTIAAHQLVLAGGGYTRNFLVQVETPRIYGDDGLVPVRPASWFDEAELAIVEIGSVGGFRLSGGVDVRLEADARR